MDRADRIAYAFACAIVILLICSGSDLDWVYRKVPQDPPPAPVATGCNPQADPSLPRLPVYVTFKGMQMFLPLNHDGPNGTMRVDPYVYITSAGPQVLPGYRVYAAAVDEQDHVLAQTSAITTLRPDFSQVPPLSLPVQPGESVEYGVFAPDAPGCAQWGRPGPEWESAPVAALPPG